MNDLLGHLKSLFEDTYGPSVDVAAFVEFARGALRDRPPVAFGHGERGEMVLYLEDHTALALVAPAEDVAYSGGYRQVTSGILRPFEGQAQDTMPFRQV